MDLQTLLAVEKDLIYLWQNDDKTVHIKLYRYNTNGHYVYLCEILITQNAGRSIYTYGFDDRKDSALTSAMMQVGMRFLELYYLVTNGGEEIPLNDDGTVKETATDEETETTEGKKQTLQTAIPIQTEFNKLS